MPDGGDLKQMHGHDNCCLDMVSHLSEETSETGLVGRLQTGVVQRYSVMKRSSLWERKERDVLKMQTFDVIQSVRYNFVLSGLARGSA